MCMDSLMHCLLLFMLVPWLDIKVIMLLFVELSLLAKVLSFYIYVFKVEFMPKFSVSGIWKRWRESYPKDGAKLKDATTVFTGVCHSFTNFIYLFMSVYLSKIILIFRFQQCIPG